MKQIIIDYNNLIINDNDNCIEYTIQNHNDSDLYYAIEREYDENGDIISECEARLVRNEVKRYGDINKIDETLEMIRNKENDNIYTDNMLDFIDKRVFESLNDESKEDYECVEFIEINK